MVLWSAGSCPETPMGDVARRLRGADEAAVVVTVPSRQFEDVAEETSRLQGRSASSGGLAGRLSLRR